MEVVNEQIIPREVQCAGCSKSINPGIRFCPHCGILQGKLEDEVSELKRHLVPLAVFFFTSILFLGILSAAEVLDDYESLFYTDLTLSAFILIFIFIDLKEIKPLLKFKIIKIKILLPILLISVLYALLVNVFVHYINVSVLNEGMSRYYPLFKNSAFPLLFTILSIAVQPAIFEELAFRGFVLNKLNKVSSVGTSIFISALMFAIIHMSIISVVWIIPFGMFYGYLRTKYHTLWYGIFAHFTHNFTVIVLELHEDGLLDQYWEFGNI